MNVFSLFSHSPLVCRTLKERKKTHLKGYGQALNHTITVCLKKRDTALFPNEPSGKYIIERSVWNKPKVSSRVGI